MSAALEISDVTMSFPGQVVLDDVSLALQGGEIHALVGQNGSGKSTLVKILSGYHRPNSGSVSVDDRPLRLGDPRAAATSGLRFVHQDLALVESLSVTENLVLGSEYLKARGRRIRWRAEHNRAGSALEELGASIDPRRPVSTLNAAQRTEVAVTRAVRYGETRARVLVLDEPTATLPADDVQRLFEALHHLRNEGLAILFVSHHLDEVRRIADQVTVLRDGRVVSSVPARGLDRDLLIELIVGRRVEIGTSSGSGKTKGTVALSAIGVGGSTVEPLNLEMSPGEIVGVAGLDGSGREALVALLCGRLQRTGKVQINGREIPPFDPKAALSLGMGFIPGDRARFGIIQSMTVRENITLTDVQRHVRRHWLSRSRERAECLEWIQRLNIVTQGTESSITTLSGGNQQKVLLARCLRLSPHVLLLNDPTAGVDVGAKEEIHSSIDRMSSDGAAVLVASTDSEELVRLCQRVLVMVHGHIAAVLEAGRNLTVESIDSSLLAPDDQHLDSRAS